MSARYCTYCGTPVTGSGTYCASCGAPLVQPATPGDPLSSAAPESPQPDTVASPDSQRAPPGEGRRRSRTKLIVIVVVVILVIGGGVGALLYLATPAPQVEVAEIDIWAPDNVCGLSSNPTGFQGFNDSPGAVDEFQLLMPNYNTTSCTIEHLITNSTGFVLSNISLPLTIPGSPNAGNPVSESLNLTLTLPDFAFDGFVNLVAD